MVVGHLVDQLANLGCQIEVLAQVRASDPVGFGVTRVGQVTVRRFRNRLPSRQFAAAPSLWQYLRRHGHEFEIVHAHSFHATPAAAAAFATDRPLVFSPHYHGVGHTPLARALHLGYGPVARRLFDRSAQVICVSNAEANLVRRDFPQVSPRLRVVPNGVDVEGIRAAEPFDVEAPVILMAGRLEAYKQFDLAISALVHLSPQAVLVIIGHGPERARLEAVAESAGVAHRVQFLGRVSDQELRRWLRTASVVLTLSRHEAFGLVILEGIAGGAWVIASDIPSHREVGDFAGADVTFVSPDATAGEVAAAIASRLVSEPAEPPLARLPVWPDLAVQVLAIYRDVLSAAQLG